VFDAQLTVVGRWWLVALIAQSHADSPVNFGATQRRNGQGDKSIVMPNTKFFGYTVRSIVVSDKQRSRNMGDDGNRWVLKLVCLALAVTATGCTTPVILQQRVVEVEKIVLKDTAGNIRFEVTVKEDGSLVQTLRDKKGNERIALMVDAEGVARQSLFGEDGQKRVHSYVFPTDHPQSAGMAGTDILNREGKIALESYIDSERVTRHILHDENEKSGVLSYVFPADHPKLPGWTGADILNKEGKTALRSVIDSQRVARHQLFNENGAIRIGSYVNPTDHPKMAELAGTEWINGNNGAWMRINTAKDGGPIMSLWIKTIKSASR
jgi:hypothetical protein